MSPESDIQNAMSGVQTLTINDSNNPFQNNQVPTPQVEPIQSPPPSFLSGVPMVNPGNFTPQMFPDQMTSQLISAQQTPQPSLSQSQSVVSNMAAYSSSKYYDLFFYLCLLISWTTNIRTNKFTRLLTSNYCSRSMHLKFFTCRIM